MRASALLAAALAVFWAGVVVGDAGNAGTTRRAVAPQGASPTATLTNVERIVATVEARPDTPTPTPLPTPAPYEWTLFAHEPGLMGLATRLFLNPPNVPGEAEYLFYTVATFADARAAAAAFDRVARQLPEVAGLADEGEEIRVPPLGDESRGVGGESWPVGMAEGRYIIGWSALLVREGHVVHLALALGLRADPRHALLDVVWAAVSVLARADSADSDAVARLPEIGDLPDGYYRPIDTVHEVGG